MATPLQGTEKYLVLESCFSLTSFPKASELFLIPLLFPQSPSFPCLLVVGNQCQRSIVHFLQSLLRGGPAVREVKSGGET